MRLAIATDHNGVTLKTNPGRAPVGPVATWWRISAPTTPLHRPTTPGSAWRPQPGEGRRGRRGHRVGGSSGQGEVIACNKVPSIRAELAYSRFAVETSRGDNNANVIGSKVIDTDTAVEFTDLWLATPSKGDFHADRVAQIAHPEAGRSGSTQ